MTDRYAVVGHPVAHSKSPRIHGLFAAQTRQDMRYEALLAPLDGFVATVRDFMAVGGRGMNVTVPFKEEAFRLADTLTPRARAAGAVNTLAFHEGRIVGDNTDGAGLVADIRDNLGLALKGKRLLLLGAGGAVRGCLLPLLGEGPSPLLIANRTADKALVLAREFGAGVAGCGFGDLAGLSFDIIINGTSAGLAEVALPLPPGLFAPGALAYDMVYGRQTPFLTQAAAAGARCADGLGMLVEQAAEAFLVWRGLRPETAPVLKLLRQELARP